VEIYKGDRRGVRPLDFVRLNLEDSPSRDTAMLEAARLGLEIENDVRVATDRINKLKLPVPLRTLNLPLIRNDVGQAESDDDHDEEESKEMPLL
jgi:hypothetical protein